MAHKKDDEKLESSMLFNTNQDSLKQMTISQHVNRLDMISRFLYEEINKNRQSLAGLKQVVKNQTSNLKTSSQMLQNQIKSQLQRMKNLFQPAMKDQRKQLNQLKNQANKIMADQLTAKKNTLTLEANVGQAENQIGYKELKKTNQEKFSQN